MQMNTYKHLTRFFHKFLPFCPFFNFLCYNVRKEKSMNLSSIKYNHHLQTYKKLELEFNELLYLIMVDDEQLKTYSLKICDLILWSVVEIETITKDLYGKIKKENTNLDGKRFDDLLDEIIKNFEISELNIYLSSESVSLSPEKRKYNPFLKNAINSKNRKVFQWNNAYQNLKHNKLKKIQEFGTVDNLISSLGALYLLNIYFYFENIKLSYVEQTISTKEFEKLKSEIFEFDQFRELKYGKEKIFKSFVNNLPISNCLLLHIFFDGTIGKQKEIIDKNINELQKFKRLTLTDNDQLLAGADFIEWQNANNCKIILNRGKKELETHRKIYPINYL